MNPVVLNILVFLFICGCVALTKILETNVKTKVPLVIYEKGGKRKVIGTCVVIRNKKTNVFIDVKARITDKKFKTYVEGSPGPFDIGYSITDGEAVVVEAATGPEKKDE